MNRREFFKSTTAGGVLSLAVSEAQATLLSFVQRQTGEVEQVLVEHRGSLCLPHTSAHRRNAHPGGAYLIRDLMQ